MGSPRVITGLVGIGLFVLVSVTVAAAQGSAGSTAPTGNKIIDLKSPGLTQLLTELRDEQGIVPVDGTFQYVSGGDAVLIQLYDGIRLDRRLYLYYWPKTSQTMFLQIQGDGDKSEVHLWSESTEIAITPRGGITKRTTPSASTFRTKSMVNAQTRLSLGEALDALGCIANNLGQSIFGITDLDNIKNILQGSCVASSLASFYQTVLSCFPPSAGCVVGVTQLVSCSFANCAPSVNLDEQAKQDMRRRAANDGRFLSEAAGSFGNQPGVYASWEQQNPDWQLRWMDFRFHGSFVDAFVRIFHATNKQDHSIRAVGFNDPDCSCWNGWTQM